MNIELQEFISALLRLPVSVSPSKDGETLLVTIEIETPKGLNIATPVEEPVLQTPPTLDNLLYAFTNNELASAKLNSLIQSRDWAYNKLHNRFEWVLKDFGKLEQHRRELEQQLRELRKVEC
jgi:hypothetical protein